MSLTLFADSTDVQDALDAPVPGTTPIDRYLRTATVIVARACNLNPYDYAIPATSVDPLRDATCAQIVSWLTLGIDPAALGLDTAPVKKSSILTGDVERDTSGQAAALQCAASDLCAEAEAILLQANLLWQALPSDSGSGCLPHFGLPGPRPAVSQQWANTTDAWSWG